MKKVDRIKELEKIADKLGIGQNREVKCVGCKKKFKFKNVIILTNKKKVSHLCKGCYKKLEKGELNKKRVEQDEILKEIDAFRKKPLPHIPDVQPAPYLPKPIDWEPFQKDWPMDKIKDWDVEPATYTISSITNDNKILKMEVNHGNETSSNT
jgi:hypothetical protein